MVDNIYIANDYSIINKKIMILHPLVPPSNATYQQCLMQLVAKLWLIAKGVSRGVTTEGFGGGG